MTPDLAHHSVNALVWYRPTSMPALAPIQVRILRAETRESGWTVVVVTEKLGLADVVNVGETIDAIPSELHFELDSFDPPSSGSVSTIPAPPPDFDDGPLTERCPASAAVSDRSVSVDVR